MSTEHPDDAVEQAQAYLDQEERSKALDVLNTTLAQSDHLGAHRLRVDILLPDVDQPDVLRDSLNALHTLDKTAYEDMLPQLEENLYKRLSDLQTTITNATSRQSVRRHLTAVDSFSVLSDLFPTIHMVRGLSYIAATRLSPEKDPVEAPLEQLLKLFSEKSGKSLEPETAAPNEERDDPEKREWQATAYTALQTAVTELPQDHLLLGETYEVLGSLCKEMSNFSEALVAYQQAATHGRILQSDIDTITANIAEAAQAIILERIDTLLASQQVDAASELLDTYLPDEPLPATWRVRLAELAVQRGNFKEAMMHYDILLLGASDS